MSRTDPDGLDLDALPPRAREAAERALRGETVQVSAGGRVVGSLSGQPRVLEGSLVEAAPPEEAAESEPTHREGVTVVATAMALSRTARARLATELGAGFLVVDLHEAPATADVVLAPPVSPQLLGSLQGMFPQARVVITEIEDPELRVDYAGPVRRLLDAGAAAYLPPRPMAQVATNVRAFLTQGEAAAITAGEGQRRERGRLGR